MWSHCGVIEMLQIVPNRATEMVSSSSKLSYFDRLKYLDISTLKYRRYRADMIETYKFLHDIYDCRVSRSLPRWIHDHKRNNYFKLVNHYCKCGMRKYFSLKEVSTCGTVCHQMLLITRKASCRWQTRATLTKRLHGLCKSSGVVSCIASLPIDSLPIWFPISVLYSDCVCKMRRFGDIRLLKLPWPWNPGQGSLKVIESDTIR